MQLSLLPIIMLQTLNLNVKDIVITNMILVLHDVYCTQFYTTVGLVSSSTVKLMDLLYIIIKLTSIPKMISRGRITLEPPPPPPQHNTTHTSMHNYTEELG